MSVRGGIRGYLAVLQRGFCRPLVRAGSCRALLISVFRACQCADLCPQKDTYMCRHAARWTVEILCSPG